MPYIFVDPFDILAEASSAEPDIDWSIGSYIAERERQFQGPDRELSELWLSAVIDPDCAPGVLESMFLANVALEVLKGAGVAPGHVSRAADGGVALTSFMRTSFGDYYVGLEILAEGAIVLSTFRYGDEPAVVPFPFARAGAHKAATEMAEVIGAVSGRFAAA